MKKGICLWVLVAAITAAAQQDGVSSSNAPPARKTEKTGKRPPRRAEMETRYLNRILNQLNISKKDKARIRKLQREHRKAMAAAWRKLQAARRELLRLERENAPDEAIDKAIQKVVEAQAEQLRLTVYNRRKLRRILGEEKYEQFMQRARVLLHYRKQGRGAAFRPPLPARRRPPHRPPRRPLPPERPPGPPSGTPPVPPEETPGDVPPPPAP